jgi:hypothetical protein
MPNIKFHYLYRDAGNYKNFGSVVLVNPENLSLAEFENRLRANLIDDIWFYAEDWGLPNLRPHLTIHDPTWHELLSIEFTDDEIDKKISKI